MLIRAAARKKSGKTLWRLNYSIIIRRATGTAILRGSYTISVCTARVRQTHHTEARAKEKRRRNKSQKSGEIQDSHRKKRASELVSKPIKMVSHAVHSTTGVRERHALHSRFPTTNRRVRRCEWVSVWQAAVHPKLRPQFQSQNRRDLKRTCLSLEINSPWKDTNRRVWQCVSVFPKRVTNERINWKIIKTN